MARRGFFWRSVSVLLILMIFAGLSFWNWWQQNLKPFSTTGTAETFVVKQGMNASQVADELASRHMIRNALVFKYLARSNQVDAKLNAGEYSLSSSLSPQEIIDRLLKGPEEKTIHVTIPEGYTTEQIISTLVDKGLGSTEVFKKVIESDQFSYSFLKDAPQGPHRLDGFLFPDTYFINPKETPHEIMDMFLKRFEKEVNNDTLNRLKEMKLTIRDWVTLSSIVEKEAVQATDRPIIASVFLNRLKINKPLESCATIQYILGTPKPKLYNSDLKISSPYNTYLHAGLPPGPIANPGDASLKAVLHPAQTDYLYFVAKSDGYHAFAKTFEEHLKNVQKYEQ